MGESGGELIRGRFDRRVAPVFSWIAARMLRKGFAAVRLERASRVEMEAAALHDGELIIVINHPSWWDPIVLTSLQRAFLRTRPVMAPMDAAELRRFRIFSRIGVFGIDPDDPRSARLALAEVARRWAEAPETVLMVTPQGRFSDPREPIRLRPGAAMIAARCRRPAVLAAAVEYPFWSDRRPEVLIRVRRVANPTHDSARTWLDAMSETMEDNRKCLAELSVARSAEPFETLIDGAAPSGPYALWLRLAGRGARVDASRRDGHGLAGPAHASNAANSGGGSR